MDKALKKLSIILLTGSGLLSPAIALALPADHYAASSVLSEGRWARVKISGNGMHIITDAELRKLGFTDPSKVHVYGTGGREVSFSFNSETPDDLPLQPSVRTARGIVFFAVDQFSWQPLRSGRKPYTHTINRYSDDNYYFLSDRQVASTEMPASATSDAAGGNVATDFIERMVYEKELEFAAESGSQIYGEDFRSKRSQTFNFTLTDAVDGEAIVATRFAAKTTNGTSSLLFKANGTQLPATASDRISSSSATAYCAVTESVKELSGLDGNLALTIDYSQTGVLFMARLDYIEAYYRRHLALNKGELYFYGTYSAGGGVSVSGCSASTRIWDVTDPACPKEVKYRLNGDKAVFSMTQSGYREFVAFDAESVTRAAVSSGMVANQDIHAMETPDMLIITHPEYAAGAQRIAALHEEHDGFRVAVIDAQQLYNEFSGGKTDIGAFRKALKMWYDRGESADGHKIRYCLLMGKPLFDNKMVMAATKSSGFKPMPIFQSYEGLTETASYSNDDVIGMLEDTDDATFSMTTATLNVAVGRLPVTNSAEAVQMAEKIEKYVKQPTYGSWRNKVMIIADDDDNGVHLDQAQDVYKRLRGSGNGASFVYDRVYLDSYKRVLTGVGATYPQATERMLRNYNEGVIYTDYIGHASPTGWGHEHLWDWESITSMTNKNLTFIFAATCRFACWDEYSQSGAELLMLNPTSGVIGMMAATRTVYVADNGRLNNVMHESFFERDSDGRALRFGDAYIRGRNKNHENNSLRFAFMGDPAIRIPSAEYAVEVTTLDGKDMTDSEAAFPELTAQSGTKVEGVINRGDGSIAEDFNGTVTLQLYDAERVITTYGQGSNGAVRTYNDRDRKLSATTAMVKNGRWSAILRVPPEIQGNYSPAQISCYAWSDSGIEANGSFERLYIYGYNPEEVTDTVGPEIEKFYVNSPNFENGGLVNSNPVVFARLRDESGINISESGIGHAMTITVDGKEIHSGLNAYFEQDAEDADAGTLAYPLEGISAGRHTLLLTVWDNANNVSKATVDINVGAAVDPQIYGITASTNPTHVDFRISLDRPNTSLDCTVGIYDLNGRRIWSVAETLTSDMESVVNSRWDLCDSGGNRVERGIYICRVTVETPEGTFSSKSKKIAISAAE